MTSALLRPPSLQGHCALSNHCQDYFLDLELQASCTIKYNFVMPGHFKKPSNTILRNNYMNLNGKVTF